MSKVVVFGGPWATEDQDGNPIKDHLGRSIEEWNHTNAWFLDQLQNMDFDVIRLPQELAVSDQNHRWGVSPFHYIPEAYDYWAGELLKRTTLDHH